MKADMIDRRKGIKKNLEEFENYKLLIETEGALKKAVLLVNKRALELNKINALSNNGPIKLETYTSEIITQQKIDEQYYKTQRNAARQLTIEDFVIE